MGDVLTLAVLLLCSLASWRLASLLHTEDAFEWLRRWIGIENDEEGYPAVWPTTFLGNVWHCFWCLTLLSSAVVTIPLALTARLTPVLAVLLWLGSSAGAIYLEKQVMRTQSR